MYITLDKRDNLKLMHLLDIIYIVYIKCSYMNNNLILYITKIYYMRRQLIYSPFYCGLFI